MQRSNAMLFAVVAISLFGSVASQHICNPDQYYGDGLGYVDFGNCQGGSGTETLDLQERRTEFITEIPINARNVVLDMTSPNGDIDTLLMKEHTTQTDNSGDVVYGDCYAGYNCRNTGGYTTENNNNINMQVYFRKYWILLVTRKT